MRDRPRDKIKHPAGDKLSVRVDDFTAIRGVPAYMNEALHNIGILTFDQLRTAGIPWLPWQVRTAIERWRRGG